MYTTWSNFKFYGGVILWLLIIFAMLLVGWGMSFTSIDLSITDKTNGVVTSAGVTQTITGRTGYVNSFVVHVDNSPDGYWIYRSSRNYSDLFNSLRQGTEVTIYHSSKIESKGLYTVYQLQHANHVDYSKDEYEGKEKLAGRLIVLPGAIAMLVMMFFQIRKRLRKGRLTSTILG